MIQLAVFLGNPGVQYARNRHNAGRLAAERLPFYGELSWKRKYRGLYAFRNGGHFLQPETFMNASGESAAAACSFFKIDRSDVLVLHDELELPLGTVSLKEGGGLGGHNGLRSLKAQLGGGEFWRIRIGIGRPPGRLPGEGGPPGSGGDVYNWVLSDFSESETQALEAALAAAAELTVLSMEGDPEALLPEWRKKALYTQASQRGELHLETR